VRYVTTQHFISFPVRHSINVPWVPYIPYIFYLTIELNTTPLNLAYIMNGW
jgi:hypothetical protein